MLVGDCVIVFLTGARFAVTGTIVGFLCLKVGLIDGPRV